MEQFDLGTIIAFAIGAILVENIVLSRLFGCGSFFGLTRKKETAVGMGILLIAIMGLSSLFTYCVYQWVLVPFQLEYLRTMAFMLLIALLVQLVEMVIKKYLPALYHMLGIYLPLMAGNCAVLGVCLSSIERNYNLASSVLYAVFSAVGFLLVAWVFTLVRDRIEENDNIPKSFQGFPITLIAAALLAFGFMGFSGVQI